MEGKMKQVTHRRLSIALVCAIVVAALFGAGSVMAVDSTQNVTVKVNSYIGLTTTAPTTIVLTPTATSASGESTSSAIVNTNNSTGYTLTVQMNADASTLSNGTATIAAGAAAGGDVTNLTDNTWGFKGGDITAYTEMPTDAGPAATLKATTGTASGEQTVTTFGAKVNNTQATGTYTGTVKFTATANAG
jgi:hypothetical protein